MVIQLKKYRPKKCPSDCLPVAIGKDPHYCPICNLGKTAKTGNDPVLSAANGSLFCRKCGHREADI